MFWSELAHLQHASAALATGRKGNSLLRRVEIRIHAVDSTVIPLVANLSIYLKKSQARTMPTGQWSEPSTSGRMNAAVTRGISGVDTPT